MFQSSRPLEEEFGGNFTAESLAKQLRDRWPEILSHVGETYRRAGNHGKSREYFKKALRLDPDNPMAEFGMELLKE